MDCNTNVLHRRNSWRISEAPEEDHISSAPACTELGFFYPFFDYLLVVERADLEAITSHCWDFCVHTDCSSWGEGIGVCKESTHCAEPDPERGGGDSHEGGVLSLCQAWTAASS